MKKILMLAVVFFVIMLVALGRMEALYKIPYPHFDELASGENTLRDAGGLMMGFRSAAADVAWIQLIQYCGKDILEQGPEGGADKLKPMTLRIVRLDPYFYEAYTFSAGILAWFNNIDRPDQAVEILKEGIKANPKYWAFRLYLAAIVYKKAQEYGKMAAVLEEAAQYPDCPLLLKAILANYYRQVKQYPKAVLVWESMLSCGDPAYEGRARNQLFMLRELMGSHGK